MLWPQIKGDQMDRVDARMLTDKQTHKHTNTQTHKHTNTQENGTDQHTWQIEDLAK